MLKAGADLVIFLQQAGTNRHEHISESLELIASDRLLHFQPEVAAREARKRAELVRFIWPTRRFRSSRRRRPRAGEPRIRYLLGWGLLRGLGEARRSETVVYTTVPSRGLAPSAA